MSIKKKLLVSDVMLNLEQFSVLDERAMLKDAFEKMSYWNLGISCIVNTANQLLGNQLKHSHAKKNSTTNNQQIQSE